MVEKELLQERRFQFGTKDLLYLTASIGLWFGLADLGLNILKYGDPEAYSRTFGNYENYFKGVIGSSLGIIHGLGIWPCDRER